MTGAFRAELSKLRSVRSTIWLLVAAVGFNLLLAVLLAIFLPGQLDAHQKATLDVTRVSLGGLHLSQVAFGVLGVLVIGGEYSSGTIRATLAAVPRRRLMLGAKVGAFTTVASAVAAGSTFAAYFAFEACLPTGSLNTTITDPGVLRAVVGGALYLTVLGLLGLGLGAIFRSSVGAVTTLLGLLLVPPLLIELLPESWQDTIGPYVPLQAGTAVFSRHQTAGTLAPWVGFGVLCAYAALALATGFILIDRRDA